MAALLDVPSSRPRVLALTLLLTALVGVHDCEARLHFVELIDTAGPHITGMVYTAAIPGLNQKLEQKQTEITELRVRSEKLDQVFNQKLNGGAR